MLKFQMANSFVPESEVRRDLWSPTKNVNGFPSSERAKAVVQKNDQ